MKCALVGASKRHTSSQDDKFVQHSWSYTGALSEPSLAARSGGHLMAFRLTVEPDPRIVLLVHSRRFPGSTHKHSSRRLELPARISCFAGILRDGAIIRQGILPRF